MTTMRSSSSHHHHHLRWLQFLVSVFTFSSIIGVRARELTNEREIIRRLQYNLRIIDGFIDTEACYQSLLSADVNSDFEIVLDEYLILLQEAGPPGFLSDISDGRDIPEPLQSTFYELACLCLEEPGASSRCCNPNRAKLPIDGLENPNGMDDEQYSFLFTVCSDTGSSIEAFINTPAPSVTPTLSPSDVPSSRLTAMPTRAPTRRPSSSPSSSPTDNPTISPTLKPSPEPTRQPTISPSDSTLRPTMRPTPNPTEEPTLTASEVPTTTPSAAPSTLKPTTAPTPSPSMRLTPNPTAEISEVPTLSPEPSAAPTGEPTVAPSSRPTIKPTRAPSKAPTPSPSASPTASGTRSPTSSPQPTNSPTESPSFGPSLPPSERPSNAPTPSPSSTPTVSAQPSLAPSTSPQPTVSEQPSTSPTIGIEEADVIARTTYTVAVSNGNIESIRPSSYVMDLIASMDIVATEALQEVDFETFGSGRRRLEVRLILPTSIDGADGIQELEFCPMGPANSETDRCEEITASVSLLLDDEAPEIVRQLYEAELDRSIERGRLQEVLDEVNPSSPVTILTGLDDDGIDPSDDDSDPLSGGGIAGIIIGSVLFVGLCAALLVWRGRTKDDGDDNILEPVAPIPSGLEWGDDLEDPMRNVSRQRDDESAGSANAVFSASARKDGQKYGQQVEPDEQNLLSIDAASVESEGADSGVGAMSMDSSLMSEEDYLHDASGGRVVELEAGTRGSGLDRSAPMFASREALDAAIIAGDWSAVASSAAFLASSISGGGHTVDSRDSSHVSSIKTSDLSWKGKLDYDKAAELDALIEEGNWEGVIALAEQETGSPKSQDSAFYGQLSDSGMESETNVSSIDGSRDLSSIRQEVEDLVIKVVPEEIQNVDEMMLQFRGREQELIETLRTMQERKVSREAKKAVDIQSKLEAKRRDPYSSESIQLDSDDDFDPIFIETEDDDDSPPVDATSALNIPNIDSSSRQTPGYRLMTATERNAQRERLLEAIESGDWQIVGEISAILSENDSQIEGDESFTTNSSLSSTRDISDPNYAIAAMADRGDWTSVALEALRKQRGDYQGEEDDDEED